MMDWLSNADNQNLLKTMLIASGFGIGFFVLKGLGVLKFPFELLFISRTTKISFTNAVWGEEEIYNAISKKLATSKRWMFRSITPMYYSSSKDNREGNVVAPGEGWFFCKLNGRLAFVRTTELNKEFGQQILIHITWFTKNDTRIKDLMLELKGVTHKGVMVNYLSRDGSWVFLGEKPRRKKESVFYNPEVMRNIEEHYSGIESRKRSNTKLGIVNKSVKMFYGPPGTGKTSLDIVLATEYNKDIYLINTSNIGDDVFIRAINNIDQIENAIFVFEDIDNNPSLYDRNKYSEDSVLFHEDEDEKEKKSKKKKVKHGERVSLNTFLNFLDGPLTPENLDVTMNTNHIEKLDPALYRDSRVNLLQEVTLPEPEIIINFIEYYFNVKLNDVQKEKVLTSTKEIGCAKLMEQYQNNKSLSFVIDQF